MYARAAEILLNSNYDGNAADIAKQLAKDTSDYIQSADYSSFRYKRYIGNDDMDKNIKIPKYLKTHDVSGSQAKKAVTAERMPAEIKNQKADKNQLLDIFAKGVRSYLS